MSRWLAAMTRFRRLSPLSRSNSTVRRAISCDRVDGPTPPNAAGDNTRYTRGTSNATALATRGAAQAYDVIDLLRAGDSVRLPEKYDAVLLKALLAHGADWGQIEDSILRARPDLSDRRAQQDFITRFAGYGLADIDRALTCTEQRATLIGVGELKDGEALEFQDPLPPSLIAQTVKRRLTITLAWFSPVNTRNAKYRIAQVRPRRCDRLAVTTRTMAANGSKRFLFIRFILGQD